MILKTGFILLMMLAVSSAFLASSSSHGTSPGCDGAGCHSLKPASVTAIPRNNLQVQVTVSGVKNGEAVAGELVDADNNVVDYADQINSNTFILTAPQRGIYTVNAGYKKPGRNYGTAQVEFTTSSLNIPTPSNTRTTFQLYQNHPNPFDRETIIRFSLPKIARVELTVFDMHGQLIRELTSGYCQPGIHSVKWDGRTNDGRPVRPGSYLCQLTSSDTRIVKSMIYVK